MASMTLCPGRIDDFLLSLQHLVRLRWEELSAAERNEFANLTINLISDVVGPHEMWALKSQTAALVAEVYHLSFIVFRSVETN